MATLRRTEKEIKRITDIAEKLYAEEMSHREISEIVGDISPSSIGNYLKKRGVKARSPRELALKYTCNEKYFDSIDTKDKAYWLGFIYADGYIVASAKHSSMKLGITLSSRDDEVLKRFAKDIDFNGNIKYYKARGYSVTESCRVLISSDYLCNSLINKGVYLNKTNIITFPTNKQVPNELLYHFVRGYFDGDGSLNRTKKTNQYSLSFCGTYEFLKGVKKVLGVTSKLYQKKGVTVNNYSFSVGGNRQLEVILEKMYENAHYSMGRKFVEFLNLKQANVDMDDRLALREEELLKRDLEVVECFERNKHKAYPFKSTSEETGCFGTYIYEALERQGVLCDYREFQKKQSAQVEIEIIDLYDYGFPRTVIAKEYSMAPLTVNNILEERLHEEKSKQLVVDDKIVSLFDKGYNKSEIHRETGHSRDYIGKIIAESQINSHL